MDKEQTKADFTNAIKLMEDKAWKIVLASRKSEREQIACELIDNMDGLISELTRMIDEL